MAEWVSIKDRLPESVCDVLAFGDNGFSFRIVPMHYAQGKWFDYVTESYTDYVTHWKPMPQPTKEE